MFKRELKRIRLSLFMTQKEFADRATIPLGTYKNWELGIQLPSPSNWKKLLRFYGVQKSVVQSADLEIFYEMEKLDDKI